MKSPVHILVPDGDSPLVVPVALCLKHGGRPVRITLLYSTRLSPGRLSRFVDRAIRVPSQLDAGSALDHIRKVGADVLLPVSSAGILLAEAIRPELGADTRIPALASNEQMALVNDKWRLHELLTTTGIASPRTVLFQGVSSVDHFAPEEPLMLKPRHGTSGVGIIKVPNSGALRKRADLERLVRSGYILQAFVPGSNVDRSVLCRNGTVTLSTTQHALQSGTSFGPSSALRFGPHPAVRSAVDRLMDALSWNGVAHVDTLLDPGTGTPYVIDVNPRYWATLLGSLAAGINFPCWQLHQAMGDPVAAQEAREMLFVGIRDWFRLFLRTGLPLDHTTAYYNLADPRPKIHIALHRKRIMSSGDL